MALRHAVVLLLGLVAGCAELEPFDPPVAGEMLPGPGLFSGPDGAFVVFRPSGDEPAATAEQGAAAPEAEPPPRRKLTDPPPL